MSVRTINDLTRKITHPAGSNLDASTKARDDDEKRPSHNGSIPDAREVYRRRHL